ncbi:myosin heavy chain, muscle isoform X2 [Folsomia candida]|uniref:myosin heavy chain, muscle isoform X2 n=1 Tax=Folsomia candida TaxID=158441 RepID=UPI001604F78B|nr:myosin heavy chain, muscle isoform X2 [Folsomia candida]
MVVEKKYDGADPDPTEYLFISLEQKRIDQSKPYDAKKACWVPDDKEGFIIGEIKATKGEIVTVHVNEEDKPFKKDLVNQVNPPKFEKVEDMADLTYLSEAAVLHNLKQRYYTKLIYTYSGLFCVAINPYKRYPIYTQRVIQIYKGRRRNEVPPHIFAISDGAYSDMLTNKENQSMLITGESGAGKTENTKKVIAYFAVVGATGKKDDSKKGSLEDQIVQTNPVLEAFGNAKTVRNDNSSRFGKFIRIHFGATGKLAGADIETYLLEKARVISQQPLERSYHMFYQIMSGAVKTMKELCLLSNNILDYHYVSQGKTTIPGVDDSEEMLATDAAFDILGFTQSEKDDVYKVTAAVMHMGELKFKQRGREEQAEAEGSAEGERVGQLLGIDGPELYKNILKPRIKVGNEFVTQGRNMVQCNYSVGALAKATYDRLFKYLVKKCNETLDTKQKRHTFIGVLDIAGFEIFDFNGFEQLCINFTNERLQQFFNHHMFVLEQEEYKREGIEWTFIDFGMDLQACISLIAQPMGIMSILEEESMFPKASDQTFLEKLRNNHLGKSQNFVKSKPSKPGQVESHFSIVHYAGTVPYNLTGWLEKNKDPLNDTVVDQFKRGASELMHDMWADHAGQSGAAVEGAPTGKSVKRAKGSAFQTVSALYREQLNNLMTTLQATSPHFIRCIIPNEVKTPGLIDSHLVMHQLTCNGVLEGIRICRKGFPNRMLYPDFKYRYLVICPAKMLAEKEDKQMAQVCMDDIQLESDKYRLGHTKVFFRAGVLGQLEEIRDERLGKIVTWMQSAIRGYISKRDFKKYRDQRVALQVVQRTLRKYMNLRLWPWYRLWQKIKPLLNVTRIEDDIKKLEERAQKAEEKLVVEEKLRKTIEDKQAKMQQELQEKTSQLEMERGSLGEFNANLRKVTAQKIDLEHQLSDTQDRLTQEEEARNQLLQQKKKLEQELARDKKEIEDLELSVNKADGDKATKDHQIRNLNDEIAHQDELINKLNKEKKQTQEVNQKTAEDLQAAEDKVNHLNKVKAKLEQTLDELEDTLEREKKLRGDVEKGKRKAEGDLKLTQEAVTDLERNKKELESTIQRKDKELSSLSSKLEDEQSLVAKLQKQIKELQARIEEIEEELEAERQARAKAEKQRSDLARELEELMDRLEEAGGATAAQIELNKKREAELTKLRREVEEANIQHEAAMTNIRKKHNDAVTEMAEQLDTLNKLKAKAEKDRQQMSTELNDVRAAMDHVTNEKVGLEKLNRNLQQAMGEIQSKYEDAVRTAGDLDQSKKKLTLENGDLTRQIEDAESQLSQLNKLKVSLATQLEDTKRLADEEARERATLLGKFRNVEHDLDNAREQLNEEVEGKADLHRQLSKSNAEAQLWRAKYETEGVARAEELEESKRKLQARLQEAEETIESLNQKVIALEKTKQRLSTELEDMQLEVERATALANQLEKKQKYFDKIVAEWKAKVDDLAAELDASQKECRNYSTELFRLRALFEEAQEQLEGVKRENKNLAEEIKDLLDQIGEGGRNIHEIEKARKRLEVEKDELQGALEEAESALEQEENKVLRAQLELSQIRQEVDRRIQEKEEEFENTRKNHQRTMESMQASLEAEAKGKAEALRMKKKLEADINELELALDHANKACAEAQKSIKRYQQQLKETQQQLEEEQRARDEARELLGMAERRANALANELEEARTLLEQADRARRLAEQELGDAHDQLNELVAANGSLAVAKRKLEGELQTLHSDLEEILNEAKNSEEKAKKAMVDAARLADELRTEQEHAQLQEKARKAMEQQMKELQVRLEEAERDALKGGRKMIAKLEERTRSLEHELDGEQRRHAESQKNVRRAERRIKELAFQAEEDKKNHERMQDLVEKLQQKIKTYKRQIEEAEEIASLNLAKFRKAQAELEEAEERSDLAEQALGKMRARGGRAGSAARALSPPPHRPQPRPLPMSNAADVFRPFDDSDA